MLQAYDRSLKLVLNHGLTTMVISGLLFLATVYLFMTIPKGFLPSEDIGQIFGFTEAAQGISFEVDEGTSASCDGDRSAGPECRFLFVEGRSRRAECNGKHGPHLHTLKPRSERD